MTSADAFARLRALEEEFKAEFSLEFVQALKDAGQIEEAAKICSAMGCLGLLTSMLYIAQQDPMNPLFAAYVKAQSDWNDVALQYAQMMQVVNAVVEAEKN